MFQQTFAGMVWQTTMFPKTFALMFGKTFAVMFAKTFAVMFAEYCAVTFVKNFALVWQNFLPCCFQELLLWRLQSSSCDISRNICNVLQFFQKLLP